MFCTRFCPRKISIIQYHGSGNDTMSIINLEFMDGISGDA